MVTRPIVDLSDTAWYRSVSRGDLSLYFQDTYVPVCITEKQGTQIAVVEGFSLKSGTSVNIQTPAGVLLGAVSAAQSADPTEPEVGEEEDNENNLEDNYPQTNDAPIYIHLRTKDETHKLLLQDAVINFAFPEIGLYNYKNVCVYFQRTTQRQNKKGLCPSTGNFSNILELYYPYIHFSNSFTYGNQFSWKIATLNQVLTKEDKTEYDVAFSRVRKLKSFSRAFSRNFFLGQGIDTPEPSLWFRKTLIGNALSTKKVVIRNKAFLEEAKDFFIPRGVDVDES